MASITSSHHPFCCDMTKAMFTWCLSAPHGHSASPTLNHNDWRYAEWRRFKVTRLSPAQVRCLHHRWRWPACHSPTYPLVPRWWWFSQLQKGHKNGTRVRARDAWSVTSVTWYIMGALFLSELLLLQQMSNKSSHKGWGNTVQGSLHELLKVSDKG